MLGTIHSRRIEVCLLLLLFFNLLAYPYQSAEDVRAVLRIAIDETDIFEKQQSLLDSAYDMAKENNVREVISDVLFCRGYTYEMQDMPAKALEQYLLALQAKKWVDRSRHKSVHTLHSIYYNVGRILMYASEYDLSTQYYDSAIVEGQRLLQITPAEYFMEDSNSLFDCKLYRLDNFKSLGEDDLARRGLEALLMTREVKSNPYQLFYVLNRLGLMEEYSEKSLFYHRRALEIEGLEDGLKGMALENIGDFYFKKSSFKQALEVLDSAVELKEKVWELNNREDGIYNLFISYMSRGEVNAHLGRYDEALVDWNKAISMGFDFRAQPELFKIYRFLRDVNDSLGETVLSTAYENLLRTYDSNYKQSEEVVRVTAESEAIRDLLKSIETRNQKQNWLADYLSLSILIVLLLSILIYYFTLKYRNKKRKALFNKLSNILIEEADPD